jgi:hypothetical protein
MLANQKIADVPREVQGMRVRPGGGFMGAAIPEGRPLKRPVIRDRLI